MTNTGRSVSLKEFISAVKDGEQDFFKILQHPENTFEQASFNDLMANEEDVVAGVNRVLMKFRTDFFTAFDKCLVKYHDNCELQFVFYTTTQDFELISSVATTLFTELGQGRCNETEGWPFTNSEKILLLTKNIFTDERDDILNTWSKDQVRWLLQYRVQPLHQFSMIVRIVPPKQYDYSIRRKGTILKLLDFDIEEVFVGDELDWKINDTQLDPNGIEYLFRLNKPVFNVFDLASITIAGMQRQFDRDVHTEVTFYASGKIPDKKKARVLEKLITLYGLDVGGKGELDFFERAVLEKGGFYTGRTWRFNQWHGLYEGKMPDELFAYFVEVNDFDDEKGFKVSIWGYDQLVSLFSGE